MAKKAEGPVEREQVERSGEGLEGLAGILSADEKTPDRVLVLPLQKAVPFPGLMMPVQLGTDRARETLLRAQRQGGFIGLFARRTETKGGVGGEPQAMLRADDEEQRPLRRAEVHDVGVVAKVLKLLNLPDGGHAAMLHGVRRVEIQRVVTGRPYLQVKVATRADQPARGKRVEAQVRNLQKLVKSIAKEAEGIGDEFVGAALNIDDPGGLADFCAAYLVRDLGRRQEVLEERHVGRRLDLVVESLTREAEILELGAKIQEEIRGKIEQAQKEFFLREQIKLIRRELGEEVDTRAAEINRIREAIAAAGMPDEARAKAEEELERLEVTPVESPEHAVLHNHLDWLVSLPWAVGSEDRRDIRLAAQVLEEDHYGLAEVKERILEFLAVRKLRDSQAGPILCLAGPPGVGKTSLGRSIARAMGRRFWRFSLGGMRDEAEIKGHRRTYVGAMPGRILQGIKACGTNNPVLMLDEVDKLGSDFRGDPSSSLLEALDPEQNSAFLDHYLDVPFDLSKVFFVCTANVLQEIPAALQDRMEIIDLPGYLTAEKVEIARRHLLPKQRAAHGLSARDLSLSARVLTAIADDWTREAGVRALEKAIARICRKRSLALARGRRKGTAAVRREDLPDLLGLPRHRAQVQRRMRGPGVAQGLAWTPVGGELLYIEAASWPGKGAIMCTGKLGEVMRESVRIAQGYLLSRGDDFGLDHDLISRSDLHVHFPSGAVPKDGPSAGITIAAALLSLWLGRSCPRDLAMTGELTLVGEVLPIGGVREKVLAAKREGVRRVLLPAGNRPDVAEISRDLVKGMTFLYAETFADVLPALDL
ncbi:MAG: endopeptidase La [Planctomycetota bacterium]